MFDLQAYLSSLISSCKAAYGSRLCYIGLQGSHLRVEAAENSDIDIMVVIDGFTVADMDTYRTIIESLCDFEKSCGFICGKEDLANWNPLEICQILHTTKDIVGELKSLVPDYTREDERNYVKLGINDLYHALCHRYIHAPREKSVEKLPFFDKPLFFIIQNLHYLESGDFVLKKQDLRESVCEEDRKMLDIGSLPEGYDFDMEFSRIFEWLKNAMKRVEKA